MHHLHIYSTLLGIVWGSKCQWTWSCSHLCWNIVNPSCNHKQWLDLAWASHSSQQVSIPFEIASSVLFQRHKARIHFSSQYMLVFMMLMPSNIISHKEAISAKSYEKVSVKLNYLLCVLEPALSSRIKESYKMAAAHVADFIYSVIPKQLFWITIPLLTSWN